MLIRIPEIRTPAQVGQARQILDQAEWIDGRVAVRSWSGTNRAVTVSVAF